MVPRCGPAFLMDKCPKRLHAVFVPIHSQTDGSMDAGGGSVVTHEDLNKRPVYTLDGISTCMEGVVGIYCMVNALGGVGFWILPHMAAEIDSHGINT